MSSVMHKATDSMEQPAKGLTEPDRNCTAVFWHKVVTKTENAAWNGHFNGLGNLPLKNDPLTTCEVGLNDGTTAPARFTGVAELTAQQEWNSRPVLCSPPPKNEHSPKNVIHNWLQAVFMNTLINMSNSEHCTGWGFTNSEGHRHTALTRFVGQLLAATASVHPACTNCLSCSQSLHRTKCNQVSLVTPLLSPLLWTPHWDINPSPSHPCHHRCHFKTSAYLHRSQWPHWQTRSRLYYNLPAITSATVGICKHLLPKVWLYCMFWRPHTTKLHKDKSIIIFAI